MENFAFIDDAIVIALIAVVTTIGGFLLMTFGKNRRMKDIGAWLATPMCLAFIALVIWLFAR